MPSVTFINETQVPLHVCLKHISPLHYATVPPNGGKQTLTKVGSVWFTIQAKIDRGDNAYSNWDTYIPIVAVSVGALSLGAGAVYILGASAAAGGTSAAIATISSTIGRQAAMSAPTIRKLYSYAQKGQRIVKIGQVIGIGGGAVAGKLLGDGSNKDKRIESKDENQVQVVGAEGKKGYFSALTDWNDERKATKQAKKVLKGLLEGSVISSHGWFMNKDRTIRIVGGPKASEVASENETLLVIDTDSVQPFELIDESTGKKTQSVKGVTDGEKETTEKTALFDQEVEDGESKEGVEKPGDDYLNSVKAEKEKERELELKKQTANLSLESSEDEDEPSNNGKTFGKTLYDSWEMSKDFSIKKGSEILSRFKKEEGPKAAPSDSVDPSKDPFVKDQSETSGSKSVPVKKEEDEEPIKILLEMGFDLKDSEKALEETNGDTQLAIDILFNDPKNSNVDQILQQTAVGKETEKKESSSISTQDFKPDPVPSDPETTSTTKEATDPENPSSDPAEKKPLKVVGGEELEKPHWSKPITDLDQKLGGTSKILKAGGDYAKEWLGGGSGKDAAHAGKKP